MIVTRGGVKVPETKAEAESLSPDEWEDYMSEVSRQFEIWRRDEPIASSIVASPRFRRQAGV